MKKDSFKIFMFLTLFLISSCGGGGGESGTDSTNQADQSQVAPAAPVEESKQEDDSFSLKVIFSSVMNSFISSASAAEQQPYCETTCTAQDCVYLLAVMNNEEKVLCSLDFPKEGSASFDIKNAHLLQGAILKVETDQGVAFLESDYQTVNDQKFAALFEISKEDYVQKSKVVYGDRLKGLMLDIYTLENTEINVAK